MTYRDDLNKVLDAQDAAWQGDHDTLQGLVTDRDKQITTMTGQLSAANLNLQNMTRDRDDWKKKYTDLSEQFNDLVLVNTQFGACSTSGGTGLSVYNAISSKWGPGVTARIFNNGGSMVVQPTHPLGLIHMSSKPSITDVMSNNSAALGVIDAAVDAMHDGDVFDDWHEYDVKANQGSPPCDWPTYVAFKNKVHARVKARRSSIRTAVTVSVARFMTTKGGATNEDMTKWKSIDADIFGVDFDGGRDLTFYPKWQTAPQLIHDWAAGSFDHVAAPEFNHPRNTSDSSGSGRAAWLTSMGDAFDGLFLYVQMFDYNSTPNQELTTAAEIAAGKGLIARNAV